MLMFIMLCETKSERLVGGMMKRMQSFSPDGESKCQKDKVPRKSVRDVRGQIGLK